MNKRLRFPLILFLLGAVGCAVKGEYSCGLPNNGVRCQPMDVTHQQLYNGLLNSLHTAPFPDERSDSQVDDPRFREGGGTTREHSISNKGQIESTRTAIPGITTIRSKQAILSHPREMRIWFDRFTDPDGDLHDESFVFIRLDNGHWLIDDKPVLY